MSEGLSTADAILQGYQREATVGPDDGQHCDACGIEFTATQHMPQMLTGLARDGIEVILCVSCAHLFCSRPPALSRFMNVIRRVMERAGP